MLQHLVDTRERHVHRIVGGLQIDVFANLHDEQFPNCRNI